MYKFQKFILLHSFFITNNLNCKGTYGIPYKRDHIHRQIPTKTWCSKGKESITSSNYIHNFSRKCRCPIYFVFSIYTERTLTACFYYKIISIYIFQEFFVNNFHICIFFLCCQPCFL